MLKRVARAGHAEPMKILISADMEGARGATWPADVEPGTEQWQRCRRMFTSDVNAAIAGFFDAGATDVVVNEAHATMRNLLLEELDGRAAMLTGRHKDLGMVEGIQHPEGSGVAFVGYHAAAGTDGGRRGDRTVGYDSPTAREMIRCFKAVATLISAATEARYG